MHNIIKVHAWAEPYVNFLWGETSPLSFLKATAMRFGNVYFAPLPDSKRRKPLFSTISRMPDWTVRI